MKINGKEVKDFPKEENKPKKRRKIMKGIKPGTPVLAWDNDDDNYVYGIYAADYTNGSFEKYPHMVIVDHCEPVAFSNVKEFRLGSLIKR